MEKERLLKKRGIIERDKRRNKLLEREKTVQEKAARLMWQTATDVSSRTRFNISSINFFFAENILGRLASSRRTFSLFLSLSLSLLADSSLRRMTK